MKALAFWSHRLLPLGTSARGAVLQEARESFCRELLSVKDLKEEVEEFRGMPNLIRFEDGTMLIEGRDWTRREYDRRPVDLIIKGIKFLFFDSQERLVTFFSLFKA